MTPKKPKFKMPEGTRVVTLVDENAFPFTAMNVYPDQKMYGYNPVTKEIVEKAISPVLGSDQLIVHTVKPWLYVPAKSEMIAKRKFKILIGKLMKRVQRESN